MTTEDDAKPPPLHQIVYVSAASAPFDNAALERLLERSRRRNAERDVTGLLLHVDGSFIQVLEGTEEAVEEIYARIREDDRHEQLLILQRGPIEARRFDGWAMGFATPNAATERLEGFTSYLRTGQITHADDAVRDRVLKLVESFRHGAYRQTSLTPRDTAVKVAMGAAR